jgi:hypothetical protein
MNTIWVLAGFVFDDGGVSVVEGSIIREGGLSSIVAIPTGLCRAHREGLYYRATECTGVDKSVYWGSLYGVTDTEKIIEEISILQTVESNIRNRVSICRLLESMGLLNTDAVA